MRVYVKILLVCEIVCCVCDLCKHSVATRHENMSPQMRGAYALINEHIYSNCASDMKIAKTGDGDENAMN